METRMVSIGVVAATLHWDDESSTTSRSLNATVDGISLDHGWTLEYLDADGAAEARDNGDSEVSKPGWYFCDGAELLAEVSAPTCITPLTSLLYDEHARELQRLRGQSQ